MKCRIERKDFVKDLYDVYLWDQEFTGRHFYMKYHGDGVWSHEEILEGGLIVPTFSLPAPLLEAIAREVSGIIPPTEATTEHLKDARAVRDRLLTLVEKGARRG